MIFDAVGHPLNALSSRELQEMTFVIKHFLTVRTQSMDVLIKQGEVVF